jgi:hypothetical protein
MPVVRLYSSGDFDEVNEVCLRTAERVSGCDRTLRERRGHAGHFLEPYLLLETTRRARLTI